MCWFVALGVPQDAAAQLDLLADDTLEFGLSRAANPRLRALFPSTDVLFWVTHGGCSCDLWIDERARHSETLDRTRREYEKKGWSKAKIARALASTQQVQSARVLDSTEAHFRQWNVEFVERFGAVRLFAHLYRGSQDEEQVDVIERRRLDTAEFLTASLPADVTVEISRSGA